MESSKIYQSKLFVYTAVDIRDEIEEVFISPFNITSCEIKKKKIFFNMAAIFVVLFYVYLYLYMMINEWWCMIVHRWAYEYFI